MIEFDASRVVIDVNGREVIEFGGTRPTMPTDTEMLDFIIDNGAYINAFYLFGETNCYVMYAHDVEKNASPAATYKNPRSAIAAEMAKEAK